jgi:hypothetical protein
VAACECPRAPDPPPARSTGAAAGTRPTGATSGSVKRSQVEAAQPEPGLVLVRRRVGEPGWP